MIKTPNEISPYNLMQERYRDDPWALLVGCILFNMVRGSKAQPIHEAFLERWRSPTSLFNWKQSTIEEMSTLLKPLGLQNRRTTRIMNMTADWVYYGPRVLRHDFDITKLHGVGKYGADSFNMFCRGYLVEDAKDKELRKYVQWARSKSERAGEGLRSVACEPCKTGETCASR